MTTEPSGPERGGDEAFDDVGVVDIEHPSGEIKQPLGFRATVALESFRRQVPHARVRGSQQPGNGLRVQVVPFGATAASGPPVDRSFQVCREPTWSPASSPFGPAQVALRERQLAQDLVEESGVQAVRSGPADLPQTVECGPALPLAGMSGNESGCERVNSFVVEKAGLGIEFLGEHQRTMLIRGDAPQVVPGEAAWHQ